MARELFHTELAELTNQVLLLGSMTEKAIVAAVQSLRNGDRELSEKVVAEDADINAKRFEIEDRCINMIARQAPVASELRALISMLFISSNLERMADHGEGIARINLMTVDEPLPRNLGYIPAMADRALAMLRDSLTAFVERDAEAAARICDADDEVDNLQDSVYHECLMAMIADPSQVTRLTHQLWTAHNLERIADRATNICERTIFLVTGQMTEINVSRY